MNPEQRERRQIADACTAVIAAAIEDVLAEYPEATPEAQARSAVRALRTQGWHITVMPLCALQTDEHAPVGTQTPDTPRTAALRSA
ncbi:hypothetical protein ACH4YN_37900 [Streptomyces griseofuscus]|uniref:hypothetical protein n=1 Tax=Streptomyces griseofuscus TaxID=146922 RepID=UPI0037BC8834